QLRLDGQLRLNAHRLDGKLRVEDDGEHSEELATASTATALRVEDDEHGEEWAPAASTASLGEEGHRRAAQRARSWKATAEGDGPAPPRRPAPGRGRARQGRGRARRAVAGVVLEGKASGAHLNPWIAEHLAVYRRRSRRRTLVRTRSHRWLNVRATRVLLI